ncbi:MAG: hypothetical protein ABFS86_09505 [Planctomycetota bacterium]
MRPVLIALSLLLVACANRGVTVIEEHPPRPNGHYIEAWMGTSAPGDLANSVPDAKLGRPPRGIKIIGQIEQAKPTTWGWSGVVRDARVDAAKMGGDGIIIEHASGSLFTAQKVLILVFRFPDEKPAK